MMTVAFLVVSPLVARGGPEAGADRGLAVMQAADDYDSGWDDMTAELTMTLRNRNGDESLREMRMKFLEMEEDGDKSLVVFDAPRDVKGTAFLSFTHALEPDDQWLFLPALKRVKRIASANKSGPFMGSEFAYEDLSSFEIPKYTYRYVREDTHDGRPVDIVEAEPQYPHSGYTKLVIWMDREYHEPLVTEYYDRKGERLKTLTYRDYRQFEGRWWRPLEMHMVNHQTGKETELDWRRYVFGSDLTDRDFDRNALKRMR